ncbi:MAG TPA: hypothetical protein VF642_06675, partial [Propionibacteriaceae bacterium]
MTLLIHHPEPSEPEPKTGEPVETTSTRRDQPEAPRFGRQLLAAVPDAVRKLTPQHLWRSPVMFIVWVGSVVTTLFAVFQPSLFTIAIT